MEIPLFIEKARTKLYETKMAFERHHYNATVKWGEKMYDINLFIITVSLITIGMLNYLLFILLWKSSSDWTIVERMSVSYYHYRLGYFLYIKEMEYLQSIMTNAYDKYQRENVLNDEKEQPYETDDKDVIDMLLRLNKTTKME